jgi:hypothetical protein
MTASRSWAFKLTKIKTQALGRWRCSNNGSRDRVDSRVILDRADAHKKDQDNSGSDDDGFSHDSG